MKKAKRVLSSVLVILMVFAVIPLTASAATNTGKCGPNLTWTLDTETGELTAIIIFGRPKFFGLIGKQEDIIIPWKDIKVIGPETVLVSSDSAKFAALLG